MLAFVLPLGSCVITMPLDEASLMRVCRTQVATSIVAVVACGCTLIMPLDGYDRGTGGSGGASRGPTSTPSSAASGGGATGSGGQQSTVGSGGNAVPFCSSQQPAPTFCDDFDEDPLGANWTTAKIDVGGSVTLDGSTSVSAPNAARSSMAAFTGSPCRYAYDTHALDAPYTSSVRFDYDVRMGDGNGMGFPATVAINSVGLQAPGDAASLCFYYVAPEPGGGVLSVEVGTGTATGTSIDLPPAQYFANGAWTHVRLLIDAKGTVSLWIEDMTTALVNQQPLPSVCGQGLAKVASLGLLCVGPDLGAFDMRVDNFAVWAE